MLDGVGKQVALHHPILMDQLQGSVSANTTYGFSVVKNTYSGSYGLRSVGHGLGKTPSLVN